MEHIQKIDTVIEQLKNKKLSIFMEELLKKLLMRDVKNILI